MSCFAGSFKGNSKLLQNDSRTQKCSAHPLKKTHTHPQTWIAFLRFSNRVKRSSSLCSNIHSTKKIRSSFSRTSFLPVSFFPVASTLKSTCLLFITKMWADHFSKSRVDPCIPMHLYTINHTKSSNPLLGAGKGSQTGRKKSRETSRQPKQYYTWLKYYMIFAQIFFDPIYWMNTSWLLFAKSLEI